jgi:penicillin-binding protein 1C
VPDTTHSTRSPSPPSGGEGRGEGASPRVTSGDVLFGDSAPLTPTLSPQERGEGALAPCKKLIGWRSLRLVASITAFAIVVTSVTFGLWVRSLGPAPLGEKVPFSTVVVDRDGRLLRAFATADGRWRLPVRVDQVDPRYIQALLGYEDNRFYEHRGVDPLAMLRALGQLIYNGHIVSGGSTITMQVARLLEPRDQRSLGAKLRQAVRAIEIERRLSKSEVLTLYLNLAPFGGNLEGVRAASLAYFGHDPRRLTLGEAALLVALPQSPEARRPDRAAAVAKAARDRVLDRLEREGIISAADAARAKAEPVPTSRRPMPMLAPQAAEAAVAAAPDAKLIRLTIDAPWQKTLEELVRDRARALGPDISIAIVVADNATGEVLARVGSADYFDQRRAGAVDMTRALRSPGSTLKPFIYGLGFEDGFIHPDTLIDDRPTRYGSYAPTNFDLTFQGTIPVRRALQLSLNVPAVAVLDRVGPSRFAARVAQAGSALVLPKGETPGLAMALGGLGITLEDLVKLYVGLARGGTTIALTERRDQTAPVPQPRRLMDPIAAWYVGNVLLGTPPPENAVGGRIAFKTGTSYGYRDAWAVGFDGRYTIGVWVGRPDGAPMPGMIGHSVAAPVLFDAFARSGRPLVRLARPPRHAIIATNARLPLPLRHFRPEGLPSGGDGPPLKIMFPPNGAQLELASAGTEDRVPVKIVGGRLPLTVLMNGVPLKTATGRHEVFFSPDGPGFVRLTVMDAKGTADSVVVRLQ